jgi:hypothetical protein
MTVLELDHLAYIKHRPYRRKAHAAFRRFVRENPGGLALWDVLHEANDSCCRREPWIVTRASLLQALADDGLSSALLVVPSATTT